MSLLRNLHTAYLWPVLTVGAVLYLVWMLYSRGRSTTWTPAHRLASLGFLILLDLQWLIGAVLWTVQQRWTGADPLRSFEHPFNMIIALAVYHVGYARLKRDVPAQVHFTTAAVWSGACLVVFGLGIIRIGYL